VYKEEVIDSPFIVTVIPVGVSVFKILVLDVVRLQRYK